MKDGITSKERMKAFAVRMKRVKRPTLQQIIKRKMALNSYKGEKICL